MSTVAVAVLLAVVVVVLVRSKLVRPGAAIVCGLFGFVLGLTPLGDPVGYWLATSGDFVWQQVTGL